MLTTLNKSSESIEKVRIEGTAHQARNLSPQLGTERAS